MPLGYISGVFGIKGWVKIHSWTSPREGILEYQPWFVGEDSLPVCLRAGGRQGKTVVAALPGIDSPEQARTMVGRQIAVDRDQLPELQGDNWYWADLEGLAVETQDGVGLGHIEKMMETGAHDVMIVRGDRERLIPFVPGRFVLSLDLDAGRLVVNWDPDYLA